MNHLTSIDRDISDHILYRKKLAEIKEKYPPKEYIRPEYVSEVVFKLKRFNK